MPFQRGSISYARFAVIGEAPRHIDESLVTTIAEHQLTPPEVGAPPELQVGFCGPQHVFDTDFAPETVAFGSQLLIGLRADTNKVPGEIRRAYRAMSEQQFRQASATGVVHRGEKQIAREEADARCREELAAGRHRKSKMIPLVWDLEKQMMFAPIFSDALVQGLNELMKDSFNCSVQPLSSGALASRRAAARGLSDSYEDLKPTPFTPPPPRASSGEDGDASSTPIVPWTMAGPEPKDFLGNEFVIWLWQQCDAGAGLLELDAVHGRERIAIMIDRVLDMDCAWDATGKQSLRADGPTKLPEALKALQFGKWPRKAGLMVSAEGEHWQLTFQADRFLLTGIKIAQPEDAAEETMREATERRLISISRLDAIMTDLFDSFLQERIGTKWNGRRDAIRTWIRRKTVTPSAEPKPAGSHRAGQTAHGDDGPMIETQPAQLAEVMQ